MQVFEIVQDLERVFLCGDDQIVVMYGEVCDWCYWQVELQWMLVFFMVCILVYVEFSVGKEQVFVY